MMLLLQNQERKQKMKDPISRQAAIDAVRKCSVKEVTSAYMLIDKAEAMTELMLLPSAQPAIISTPSYTVSVGVPMEYAPIVRCKDCKYWHREIHDGIEYFNFSSCDLNHYGDGHNFYCADAERRTDE